MKRLLYILSLLPIFAYAQTNVTTIPGKLKVKVVPRSPATGDMMVTIDTNGNVKKDTLRTGGGSATGVNGNTGTTNIGWGGTFSGDVTETLAGHNFTLNQTSGN